jgi:hypothetical protein
MVDDPSAAPPIQANRKPKHRRDAGIMTRMDDMNLAMRDLYMAARTKR